MVNLFIFILLYCCIFYYIIIILTHLLSIPFLTKFKIYSFQFSFFRLQSSSHFRGGNIPYGRMVRTLYFFHMIKLFFFIIYFVTSYFLSSFHIFIFHFLMSYGFEFLCLERLRGRATIMYNL